MLLDIENLNIGQENNHHNSDIYKLIQKTTNHKDTNLSNYRYIHKIDTLFVLRKQKPGLGNNEAEVKIDTVEELTTLLVGQTSATYKYTVGDIITHKRTFKTGKIINLATTDNGKHFAYTVVTTVDLKRTKWSESMVTKTTEASTVSTSSESNQISEPKYIKGDSVLLVTLDTARKSDDWYIGNDVPKGWGGPSINVLEMFGKLHKILETGNNCVIDTGHTHRIIRESLIEKLIPVISEVQTPWVSYSTSTDLITKIKTGDKIKVHSKEYFEQTLGLDINGDPNANVVWSSDGAMHRLFGLELIVTAVHKDTVIVKFESDTSRYLSSDCFTHLTLPPTGDDGSGISSEDSISSEEPVKPKPIKYKQLNIKEEIEVMMPTPILLEGPVGSGKSTILMELAEDLGLRYFAMVMSDATNASEFKGYKNVVDGKYVAPEFRDALENGGLYVLEELNATTSNMPIIFNSIENGYFVFADKSVKVHKDFRLCATMNTITNAHDFGGRRQLDKSVRDRFYTIIVKTDYHSRFTPDILKLRDEIEYGLKANGISQAVGPRDLTKFIKLKASGIDPVVAVQKTLDLTSCLSIKFIADQVKHLEK